MVRDVAWWDALVVEFSQQQSLGLRAFCLSRGVKPSQLHYQQRKRDRRAVAVAVAERQAPAFREYLLPGYETPALPVPSAVWGIRLHVGGVVIELPPGFADAASLRTVLSCCR